MDTIQSFNSRASAGRNLPDIRPGQTIKVHQKIKDGNKTRTQIFAGIVIAHKHGNGPNGMITVRKISNDVGVERTFPLHMPTVEKFEIVRTSKVRRSKLYYLRDKSARETRKKTKLIETKVSAPQTETKESTPAQQES
mgnify:FL=1